MSRRRKVAAFPRAYPQRYLTVESAACLCGMGIGEFRVKSGLTPVQVPGLTLMLYRYSDVESFYLSTATSVVQAPPKFGKLARVGLADAANYYDVAPEVITFLVRHGVLYRHPSSGRGNPYVFLIIDLDATMEGGTS
jgi:hypothetical protein